MKKVCFLIGNIGSSGGTERVTSLIANGLSQQHEIYVLSLFASEQPFFPLEKNIQLFSLFAEKKSMKLMYFSAVLKIRQFMLEHQIDSLIVVDTISTIFTIPALIGLKTKHICWEHFNFLNNNGSRLRDFSRQLAVKYCDVVVTLTQRDQQLWQQNLSRIRAKMIAISNPSPYENQQHQPSQEAKIVLVIGRLCAVKGFDLLLQAWASVSQQHPDWQLKIVGGGEEEQALKDLAAQLQLQHSVDFVGRSNDVASYYRQGSIFCLSSRYEGLPMTLLEAQAFALPIVAFDCETGPAELITVGKNGFLAEKENVADLAKQLSRMMALDAKSYHEFSQHARQNSEKYNQKNIIKEWSVLINQY